jgi:hypothetical protein
MAITVLSTASAASTTFSTGFEFGSIQIDDPNALIVVAGACSTQFNAQVFWDSSGANSSFTHIAGSTGAVHYSRCFVLANPSTGTHSIHVTMNAVVVGKLFGAVAYAGTDSTTPYSTATQSSVSGTSSAVTSSAMVSSAGNVIVSWVAINGQQVGSVTDGAGQTRRIGSTTQSQNMCLIMSDRAGAASTTASYTWTNSTLHSFFAMELIAAGAAAGTVSHRPPRRGLMGAGR